MGPLRSRKGGQEIDDVKTPGVMSDEYSSVGDRTCYSFDLNRINSGVRWSRLGLFTRPNWNVCPLTTDCTKGSIFRNIVFKKMAEEDGQCPKLWPSLQLHIMIRRFRLSLNCLRITGILNTRKHDVLEITSVSVPVCERRRQLQWLKLALSKGPHRVGVSRPWSDDENRSSFRNVAFSSVQNSESPGSQ
jgi:hypothetical protein